MAVVRPISDLRNKTKLISQLVHKQNEPVIITKNGEGDMVVLDFNHYKKLQARLELYEKLAIAEEQDRQGMPTYPLKEVIDEIKKSLGA